MRQSVVIKGVHYDTSKIIECKGRGVHETVAKVRLRENEHTVTTSETTSVICYPEGNEFVVLVRPLTEFKDKQQIIIMSKYVLKKLNEIPNNVNTSEMWKAQTTAYRY